jgi:hypothetical protein
MIVGSYGSGTVDVLRVGDEGFQTLATYRAWLPRMEEGDVVPVRAVAAGDFDGDSRCDFVAAGFRGAYLAVMSRNDRAVDKGYGLFHLGYAPVDLHVVDAPEKPALVFISGEDRMLIRWEMEFLPKETPAAEAE